MCQPILDSDKEASFREPARRHFWPALPSRSQPIREAQVFARPIRLDTKGSQNKIAWTKEIELKLGTNVKGETTKVRRSEQLASLRKKRKKR